MHAEPLTYHLALGLTIVVLGTAQRFDTPSWGRSYTTAARFGGSRALYVSLHVLLYAVLLAGVRIVALPHAPNPIAYLGSPVLVAIAVAWLVPALPRLRQLDLRARETCRTLAGVPAEADRLAKILSSAPYEPPADVRQGVVATLQRRGLPPSQHWLEEAESVRRTWVDSATLFHQLRGWTEEPRHAAFILEAQADFDSLRLRFDELAMRVARTFDDIERLAAVAWQLNGGDERNSPRQTGATMPTQTPAQESTVLLLDSVDSDLEALAEDVTDFRRAACLFLARAVLSAERFARDRQQRLSDLGFGIELRPAPFLILLVYAFTVFALSFVAVSTIVGVGYGPDHSMASRAMLAVMIGTVQIVAIAVAVVPKTLWGFANVDIFGRTPFAFIFGAGVVALFLALVVSHGFRLLMFGSWSAAADHLAETYRWLLMCFVNASITAYLVQDNRWANLGHVHTKRWLDGTLLALGMGITATVVGAVEEIRPIFAPTIAAAAIGLLIGYVVPAHFRAGTGRARRARHRRSAAGT